MENKTENHSPKLNSKAELSFLAGIGALAPYLYIGVAYFFYAKNTQQFNIKLFCCSIRIDNCSSLHCRWHIFWTNKPD